MPYYTVEDDDTTGLLAYYADDFDGDGTEELLEISVEKEPAAYAPEHKFYFIRLDMYEAVEGEAVLTASQTEYASNDSPNNKVDAGFSFEEGRLLISVYSYNGKNYIVMNGKGESVLFADGISEEIAVSSYDGSAFTDEYYGVIYGSSIEPEHFAEHDKPLSALGLPKWTEDEFYTEQLLMDGISEKKKIADVTATVRDDAYSVDYYEGLAAGEKYVTSDIEVQMYK